MKTKVIKNKKVVEELYQKLLKASEKRAKRNAQIAQQLAGWARRPSLSKKTKTKKKRLDDEYQPHMNLQANEYQKMIAPDFAGIKYGEPAPIVPAPGTKRIVWENGRYVIEEYSAGGYDPSYSVAIRYWNAGWEPRHEARTLWGIKRLWRKLYGTETPFPSLKLVYGEAGK